MAERIRIAIVDEHPLFRQGVVRTIDRDQKMIVVAEGRSADDALRIASQSQFDVLLMDIGVSGGGIEATRKVLAVQPSASVAILTASDDEEHLAQAIAAGAKGYILKGVSGIELLRLIETIHKGEPYITPSLATRVLMQAKAEAFLAKGAISEDRIELTVREQQVLSHVTQGLTNMEIATKLGVSLTTIKHNISDLFRKIRVRNRMEATFVAQKLKLV
jgi:two-component system nitrate/nitrite response regulator NarL